MKRTVFTVLTALLIAGAAFAGGPIKQAKTAKAVKPAAVMVKHSTMGTSQATKTKAECPMAGCPLAGTPQCPYAKLPCCQGIRNK